MIKGRDWGVNFVCVILKRLKSGVGARNEHYIPSLHHPSPRVSSRAAEQDMITELPGVCHNSSTADQADSSSLAPEASGGQ